MKSNRLREIKKDFQDAVEKKCSSTGLKTDHYIDSNYTLYRICEIIEPLIDDLCRRLEEEIAGSVISWRIFSSSYTLDFYAIVYINTEEEVPPSSWLLNISEEVLGKGIRCSVDKRTQDGNPVIEITIPRSDELSGMMEQELREIVYSLPYNFPDDCENEDIEEIREWTIDTLTCN